MNICVKCSISALCEGEWAALTEQIFNPRGKSLQYLSDRRLDGSLELLVVRKLFSLAWNRKQIPRVVQLVSYSLH
jgi:hypothetical protein